MASGDHRTFLTMCFCFVSLTHTLLQKTAVGTKACWEMFSSPVAQDLQSIIIKNKKNSELISLAELSNTDWPPLLRTLNEVCQFNTISTVFY